MQKLPGIGSGRRLVDVDVWNDGSTGEQSVLVRVVSFEVNPDRQALYHFDEVARCILRRQQRKRRSGPHRKAGDPALEYVPAAIHVDIEIGSLADAQVGELRLLEIGVDPDIAERADRHQILANLNVIARINVPARDDAVNLRDDVTITKVQFGLSEIAVGDFEFSLGLLDSRSLGRELSKIAVDVALFFELREHLLWALIERVDDAKLRRTLDQVRRGLETAKKTKADSALARLMLRHGRLTDEAREYVAREYPQ